MQRLQLQYLVLHRTAQELGDHGSCGAGRACGVTRVATPPVGSSAVRMEVRWGGDGAAAVGFTETGGQLHVLTQTRNEGWAAHVADVHVAVVTSRDWRVGFNATMRRADTLGSGWGVPCELQVRQQQP
jgi:hypothetical protein